MARLVVLWLLNERALTGYEIKKALSDDGMAFWFGLEVGSIYSVLRTLVKHDHAEAVGVEQPGNRPARTRYKITAAGRAHYRNLLVEALRTPLPTAAPIDVALAARGDLDPSAISLALAERTKRLHELEATINAHVAAAPSSTIADRRRSAVVSELRWLQELDQRSLT